MISRSTALIVSMVLVGVAGTPPSIADGQQPVADTKVDFTQWLRKKSYERFDYGQNGELETHQLTQFGELAPRETGCVLPIRIISFDVSQWPGFQKEDELSLLVECSNPHLVANILKFVGDSDRQHLEAKVIGDELAYPERPRDDMSTTRRK